MASPAASPLPSPPTAPPGAAPGPPKLVNIYHARTVGTAKSCFICHRETTCCLATDGVTDFIYVCRSHLLDPGFAKPAATASSSATSSPSGSPAPPAVPQAEIDKVKKEYEEKQAKKAADKPADSSDDAAKSKGPASTAFSLFKTGATALTSLSTSASTTLFPPPPPVVPSATERARAEAEKAKVFVLQRDYFAMRVAAKRREWEKKDAKERSAGWSFPKAPTGRIG